MTRRARRVTGAILAALAAASVATTVAAHPLGNATVSRGVAVTLAPNSIGVRYVVDMAEIPAFATIQAIDSDSDGAVSTDEANAYSLAACGEAFAGLALELDGTPLSVEAGPAPVLAFPPGVGGLETLRLECEAATPLAPLADGTRRSLHVADRGDDGRPGWREVTIAAESGIAVIESDVPATSPSAMLTAYPQDLLAAPIDVRAATALFAAAPERSGTPAALTETRQTPSDPLAALLTAQATAGGGVGVLLAVLVSAALGAAHALSPGHGKALVAASLVASRGTARQAAGLGLTVAASHTTGVLVLGMVVLGAGAALAPDRFLAWMSLVAGGCVVAVGGVLLVRAAGRLGADEHDHSDSHQHPHPHPHPTPHRGLATPAVIGLGLFGGLVPSTSAVIVLLLAVTTGRLVVGLALIIAFGIGMACVLSGFALLSAWLGARVLDARVVVQRPRLARIGSVIPIVSAVMVVTAGMLMTVGAVIQVL